MSDDRRGACAELIREGRSNELTLVLTAYRAPSHELGTKMVDYSRASIAERWAAGRQDMSDALGKLEAGDAAERWPGYTFYDGRRP